MTEFEILKLVGKRLNNLNINYMISGSVALNFYSEPRMTRDIDIVIEIEKNDVEKFYQLFKNDFYIDKDMIFDAINNKSMFNIISLGSIIKIDFIIKKNEEYRILEFNRRNKIKTDEMELYIVSIEDLIISKLFWAKDTLSEIQLNDVFKLMSNKIDLNYIKKWSKILKIDNILNKVLKNE